MCLVGIWVLVPSEMCLACSGTSKKTGNTRECQPIWYNRNKKEGLIQCRSCANAKRGCSFATELFGIAKWPTLTDSAEGALRRKNNARNQEKKAGTPRVRTPALAVYLTKAISLDSSLTRAMGPSTSTPLMIPSAESTVRRGDFEPVFLEDLTLGTRTQIPTRHMLDTLGVQTTSDSNVPSGYRLYTF